MGVTVRLAQAADDAALEELFANHVMPGAVRVRAMARPSFLASLAVTGRRQQTLIAEEDGLIVATATRSLLPLHEGGVELPAGRLTHLHIAPSHRGWLLARGFAALRELHADGAATCYLTTIMASNRRALSTLTSQRAGLPTYADLGLIRTRILDTRRFRPGAATDLAVRPAQAGDLAAILVLLKSAAQRRSAVPAYTTEELREGCGLLTGLGLDRLRLAWRGDRVVGCLGLWDQRLFRQQQVAGYAPWLAAVRPGWNLLAPWLGRPALPLVGTVTAYAFAALPLVEDDDPEVFSSLLAAVLADAATAGLDGLVVALHADDPLQAGLARWPGWSLESRLFAVHWEDGAEAARHLAARIPYIEGGAL